MFKQARLFLSLFLVILLLCGSGFLVGESAGRSEILVVAPSEELFSPEAANWSIPFALVSTAAQGGAPPVSLLSVNLDGEPLDLDAVSFLSGRAQALPVVMAGHYLPAEDLLEWHRLFTLAEQGKPVSKLQEARLGALSSGIAAKAREHPGLAEPSNEIIIPVSLFEPETNGTYRLEVLFQARGAAEPVGFTTLVTVTALPGYPGNSQWVGGDLHIHSTFSDGRRTVSQLKTTMKDRGYFFVYLTDHVNHFINQWEEYRQAVLQVSDAQFSMFPGAETSTSDNAHLVAYGIANLSGLQEGIFAPQHLINNLTANNPAGPSSSSIAHPLGSYSWNDYTVLGHCGMELMSGATQLYFDVYSGPGRLYRQEIMRHLNYTIGGGEFPSPRSGTDWHGYWFEPLRNYVTWVHLPAYWDSLDYNGRKAAVDQGLRDGRVSISRRGSLGFFTLDGQRVGSVIRNVPAGTVLPLAVEYRSTQSGTVYIYILRNNLEESVFYRSASMSVGQTRSWQSSIVFPGGRQLYWLYAEGPDFVYSSPIFVSED